MAWITKHVLLAGGGISEENWQEVIDLGVTAVVNLRGEHQDAFGMPHPVAYLWLPTPEIGTPTAEQLFLGAQLIDSLVKNDQRVLVHCKMGIHRSATQVVAYLIYSGLSKDEALWKFRDKGPRLFGSDEDHETLDRFIEFMNHNQRRNNAGDTHP